MGFPEHQNPSKNNVATAPYNFVPLPDTIETVTLKSLPNHDSYDTNRHTGRIEVKLTTVSPLYIRGGLSPKLFAKIGKEPFHKLNETEKRQVAQFFHTHDENNPVIPGSSLRGMLRAMIEIVTYGKVQPVSDKPLVYRAVADQMTTLRESYQAQMSLVKAGYVVGNNGEFSIVPAVNLPSGETFFKVKDKNIQATIPSFISLISDNYVPQRILCSFMIEKRVNNGWGKPEGSTRYVVTEISKPGQSAYEGVLVCSGRMQKKENHWIIPRKKDGIKPKSIDRKLVQDYQETMSEFEKEHFDSKFGCLQDGQPIFYLEQNGEIIAFGHTRNFRVPYRDIIQEKNLTPRDFVPDVLQNPETTDIAEAIFGYVDKKSKKRPISRAGRVFISDARLTQSADNIWLKANPITPKILSGAKPTTFPHYLVQQTPDPIPYVDKKGDTREKLDLSHYATSTPSKTVIRGHKLYWHQGKDPIIENDTEANKTQLTKIRPLKPNVTFTFSIYFENLSQVELGALLWVLQLGGNENYRLKLGMGKPLGMGSIKTKPTLKLTNRKTRYQSLFNGNQWEIGTVSDDDNTLADERANDFERCIRKNHSNAFGGKGRLSQLKALLYWSHPNLDEIKYMRIKPNDFKYRKVLPTPIKVLGRKPVPSRIQIDTKTVAKKLLKPLPPIPEPGSTFKGIVTEVDDKTGDLTLRHPQFPTDRLIAVMKAEDTGNAQFKPNTEARCLVTNKFQQDELWVLECSRPPKKKKKKKK